MVHTSPAPRAAGSRPAVAASDAAADLDRHVAGQAQLGLGQRAVARVGVGARGQAGHQLRGARVGRGDHALLVGDHQGVAQALDGQRQAGALGLEPDLGLLELLGHLVERGVELLDLARARRAPRAGPGRRRPACAWPAPARRGGAGWCRPATPPGRRRPAAPASPAPPAISAAERVSSRVWSRACGAPRRPGARSAPSRLAGPGSALRRVRRARPRADRAEPAAQAHDPLLARHRAIHQPAAGRVARGQRPGPRGRGPGRRPAPGGAGRRPPGRWSAARPAPPRRRRTGRTRPPPASTRAPARPRSPGAPSRCRRCPRPRPAASTRVRPDQREGQGAGQRPPPAAPDAAARCLPRALPWPCGVDHGLETAGHEGRGGDRTGAGRAARRRGAAGRGRGLRRARARWARWPAGPSLPAVEGVPASRRDPAPMRRRASPVVALAAQPTAATARIGRGAGRGRRRTRPRPGTGQRPRGQPADARGPRAGHAHAGRRRRRARRPRPRRRPSAGPAPSTPPARPRPRRSRPQRPSCRPRPTRCSELLDLPRRRFRLPSARSRTGCSRPVTGIAPR